MTPTELRAWREHAGLDQGALAERLGVTRLTLNRWENGARRVPRHLSVLLEHYADLEPPDGWQDRAIVPQRVPGWLRGWVNDGWPPVEALPRRGKGTWRTWWPTSRARAPLLSEPEDAARLERHTDGWCVVQAGQIVRNFGPGSAGHAAAETYLAS